MTALARNLFKSILLILNILIFNNILAQTVPQNAVENNDVRDTVTVSQDSLNLKKDTILPKEQLAAVVKTKA